MVVERGELWWASLPEPRGSEPGFRRPVLVVQSDDFNRSKIQTVIVAVVTSNRRLADAPGNVLLTKKSSGLPKDSVVNVSQLLTVNKSMLTKKVRRVSAADLSQVEAGLRLVLST